ncbi:adenylate/guanylate cyclase domain-containing protein [Amycolatopsis keratiniphila]|uniref:Adenylate/guanylate cyclase domain-containing protein n=1 Tax=Amycolatopsis keratiniphila subsp. keratiniphila TaxID=227715 RepID=A0A1W2LSH8_9PSEU|nr:adenylate/guanylate cyclase domain-containing protein [Amycolatopsis keratiniphila]OLZ57605.1 adenylate/guanylate cyclase domain-containing protein [Amycolatopsis keratiniphila subsp. nogabecina]ONF67845.1 adenylate/guanylate cyclase domain-containing protein [Amycolatopsis keratiniphila subsp. keratiniphila]SDU68591.1 Adenylate cyclase, class 3 [Amycolatopsis keratiniphila]
MPEPGEISPDALQQRLERILLGGKRKYTRLEVAEKAGVPEERSRRLWRALGFATVDDDEVVFTDADIEAIRTADQLMNSGLIDPSIELAVTRALGQHLSRLAEWQVHMLWTMITENKEIGSSERQIGRLVERLLPELEKVQEFVWRRHLAAYAGRAMAQPDEDLEARTEVVGFVDMVGYTRLTRQVDEEELTDILDRFESVATEVIADHHGRIVKMIGDEVLFVADSAVDGAEIALTLSERADADEALPSVRAGLASGRILSRFGDVYGSVVNLAARLTSTARPGTILVDKELATELSEFPQFEVRTRRPVSVRGYNRLRPSSLRRARDRPAGMFASSQQLAAEMLGLTDATPDPAPAPDEVEDADSLPPRPRSKRRRR